MALHCERSLIPYICRQPVAEQCSYCGHHFCMKHGHLDKACCRHFSCLRLYKRDQAISARRRWEDERLAIGQERNALGLCAQPESGMSTGGLCPMRPL
jgi:hypothetical protein